jgi:hypothetical protein
MNAKFKILFITFGLFCICFFLIPIVAHTANDYVGFSILGQPPSITEKTAARLIASLPVLLFGLLSLVCGITIVGWVMYNYLMEMQPEFTGGAIFTGFGIGPALIYFGYSSLKLIWGKKTNA